jgi:hypothetical protein
VHIVLADEEWEWAGHGFDFCFDFRFLKINSLSTSVITPDANIELCAI